MKKQMLKNILVFVIVTVLMGALIGGVYAVTAPRIRENRNRKIIEIAKELYVDGDKFYGVEDIPEDYKKANGGTLTSEEIEQLGDYIFVYDKDKNYLGLVVNASGKGYSSDGFIFGIGINKGDLIQGIKEIEFTETTGYGDVALRAYKAVLTNAQIDYRLTDFAGATSTGRGVNNMLDEVIAKYLANREALEKIVKFEAIVLDPIETIFGDVEEKEDSNFTANEVVLDRKVLEGSKASGYVYTAEEKSGDVTIKIKLYTDNDNLIRHYDLVDYENEDVTAYLDAFIDTDLTKVDETITANESLKAAIEEIVDNIIDPILVALQKSHKSTHPVYPIFGEFDKVLDTEFTATEIILEKYNITGTTINGISYVAEKNHEFTHAYGEAGGPVKLELYIDEAGVIKHYEYLEYKQTHGTYKPKIDEYLNKFIGTNASDINATMAANKNIYSGATETGKYVIDVILDAIEKEVNK